MASGSSKSNDLVKAAYAELYGYKHGRPGLEEDPLPRMHEEYAAVCAVVKNSTGRLPFDDATDPGAAVEYWDFLEDININARRSLSRSINPSRGYRLAETDPRLRRSEESLRQAFWFSHAPRRGFAALGRPPELQQLIAAACLDLANRNGCFADATDKGGYYSQHACLWSQLCPQLRVGLLADVAVGMLCDSQPLPPDTTLHASALKAFVLEAQAAIEDEVKGNHMVAASLLLRGQSVGPGGVQRPSRPDRPDAVRECKARRNRLQNTRAILAAPPADVLAASLQQLPDRFERVEEQMAELQQQQQASSSRRGRWSPAPAEAGHAQEQQQHQAPAVLPQMMGVLLQGVALAEAAVEGGDAAIWSMYKRALPLQVRLLLLEQPLAGAWAPDKQLVDWLTAALAVVDQPTHVQPSLADRVNSLLDALVPELQPVFKAAPRTAAAASGRLSKPASSGTTTGAAAAGAASSISGTGNSSSNSSSYSPQLAQAGAGPGNLLERLRLRGLVLGWHLSWTAAAAAWRRLQHSQQRAAPADDLAAGGARQEPRQQQQQQLRLLGAAGDGVVLEVVVLLQAAEQLLHASVQCHHIMAVEMVGIVAAALGGSMKLSAEQVGSITAAVASSEAAPRAPAAASTNSSSGSAAADAGKQTAAAGEPAADKPGSGGSSSTGQTEVASPAELLHQVLQQLPGCLTSRPAVLAQVQQKLTACLRLLLLRVKEFQEMVQHMQLLDQAPDAADVLETLRPGALQPPGASANSSRVTPLAAAAAAPGRPTARAPADLSAAAAAAAAAGDGTLRIDSLEYWALLSAALTTRLGSAQPRAVAELQVPSARAGSSTTSSSSSSLRPGQGVLGCNGTSQGAASSPPSQTSLFDSCSSVDQELRHTFPGGLPVTVAHTWQALLRQGYQVLVDLGVFGAAVMSEAVQRGMKPPMGSTTHHHHHQQQEGTGDDGDGSPQSATALSPRQSPQPGSTSSSKQEEEEVRAALEAPRLLLEAAERLVSPGLLGQALSLWDRVEVADQQQPDLCSSSGFVRLSLARCLRYRCAAQQPAEMPQGAQWMLWKQLPLLKHLDELSEVLAPPHIPAALDAQAERLLEASFLPWLAAWEQCCLQQHHLASCLEQQRLQQLTQRQLSEGPIESDQRRLLVKEARLRAQRLRQLRLFEKLLTGPSEVTRVQRQKEWTNVSRFTDPSRPPPLPSDSGTGSSSGDSSSELGLLSSGSSSDSADGDSFKEGNSATLRRLLRAGKKKQRRQRRQQRRAAAAAENPPPEPGSPAWLQQQQELEATANALQQQLLQRLGLPQVQLGTGGSATTQGVTSGGAAAAASRPAAAAPVGKPAAAGAVVEVDWDQWTPWFNPGCPLCTHEVLLHMQEKQQQQQDAVAGAEPPLRVQPGYVPWTTTKQPPAADHGGDADSAGPGSQQHSTAHAAQHRSQASSAATDKPLQQHGGSDSSGSAGNGAAGGSSSRSGGGAGNGGAAAAGGSGGAAAAGNSSSGSGGGGLWMASVYGDWPVPWSCAFKYRRLMWRLLARVKPRAAKFYSEEAGMCAHNGNHEMWNCVCKSIMEVLYLPTGDSTDWCATRDTGTDALPAQIAAALNNAYFNGLAADLSRSALVSAQILLALGSGMPHPVGVGTYLGDAQVLFLPGALQGAAAHCLLEQVVGAQGMQQHLVNDLGLTVDPRWVVNWHIGVRQQGVQAFLAAQQQQGARAAGGSSGQASSSSSSSSSAGELDTQLLEAALLKAYNSANARYCAVGYATRQWASSSLQAPLGDFTRSSLRGILHPTSCLQGVISNFGHDSFCEGHGSSYHNLLMPMEEWWQERMVGARQSQYLEVMEQKEKRSSVGPHSLLARCGLTSCSSVLVAGQYVYCSTCCLPFCSEACYQAEDHGDLCDTIAANIQPFCRVTRYGDKTAALLCKTGSCWRPGDGLAFLQPSSGAAWPAPFSRTWLPRNMWEQLLGGQEQALRQLALVCGGGRCTVVNRTSGGQVVVLGPQM